MRPLILIPPLMHVRDIVTRARKKLRLNALYSRLLKYAYHHNVEMVVFENLLTIRKRRYTGNRTANRKITRFAKRELLQHGVVMAMKYGFKALLVTLREQQTQGNTTRLQGSTD